MNTKELMLAARAKWKSSGLTDEQAKKLRLQPVPTANKLDAIMKPLGALKIPYWTLDGKPTAFFRVRYLEESAGFDKDKEKQPRYAQPAKTLNEVYFPPLLDWSKAAEDPSVPLYITEGEFKAAAGCSAGLFVMGLGGVDVWRSTKRECTWLPALERIVWKERHVGIVYDSDTAENPNVQRATAQLAHALLERGARPAIAEIPGAAGGKKQGLDDFLLNEGPEALRRLLNDAPALPESEALWRMNDEVVYIKDPGIVIARDSGQKMSPSSFVQHAYANRHYIEIKNTKDGGQVQVEKSLAQRWLAWPERFELKRITYRPGEGPFVDGQWNAWKGWGCAPSKGSTAPWQWLMEYIFRGDKTARAWFERWLAYPMQNPGKKMFSSSAIWGIAHGTGKTLIGHTMLRIYGENGTEISDQDLHGSFNEWAENKQFVMGDDVTGSDKRAEMDSLKRRITQQQLRINAKFVPTYVLPDCVNYLFTSNQPDAFFLEDNDRRFFIWEVVGAPAERSRYRTYDEWYKSPEGIAALFDYLLKLPLGDFDPMGPALVTNSKRSMIEDNKSDLGAWCLDLSRTPEGVLRPLGERAAKHCELLTAAQLLKAYDPEGASKVTANGLGREMKRAGFRQVNGGLPVRTGVGTQKLYAVRNAERWERAKPQACGEHWDSLFGPGSKKF